MRQLEEETQRDNMVRRVVRLEEGFMSGYYQPQ